MKNLKRVITAILASALVLTSLAGCAPETKQDSTPSTTPTGDASTPTDSKKETKKVSYSKLNYYTGGAAPEKTTVEKEVDKIILDKLGYEVDVKEEYVHFADYKEKLKVLLAGGSLPDIVHSGWYALADLIKYGDQGLVVELTANRDKLPDLFAGIDKSEKAKETAFSQEGKLYIFPEMTDYPDGSFNLAYGSAFRKDILDKHNLIVPETLDDMYKVAVALKKEYPNIYPMITFEEWEPIEAGVFGANHISGITDTGVYFNGTGYAFAPIEEGYKDALIYMNKCYTEKLIAPDFITHTSEQGKASLSKGEAFMIPKVWSGYPTEWNKAYPDQEYVLVPGLRNDKYGEPQIFTNPSEEPTKYNTSYYHFISEKSKVKVEMLEIMNLEYTKEVKDLRSWGIKDESYIIDANGEYNLAEKYIKDKTLFGKLGANAPSNERVASKFLSEPSNIFYDGKMLGEVMIYDFVRDSFDEKRLAPSNPNVVLSSDENEVFASVITAADTYAKEQKAKFITGERSFDEWDKYIEEMAKIGDIQKVLELKNNKLKK